VSLEEAVWSALSKCLNYAVAPRRIPAKDFVCGVEKATLTLPEETVKDGQDPQRLSPAQGQLHWCRAESPPIPESQCLAHRTFGWQM
jgi:hypothetical protein